MKAIRLYQIPFSHFCDKVRWSLDYYSLEYETINYVGPRTKGLEKAPRTLQKLTPIIEDPNNQNLFVSDSTPILIYLDKNYSNNKRTLFPSNEHFDKNQIIEYCLKLDSQFGLYVRRLAYLHVIYEQPALLSFLIDGNFVKTHCDDWKSYIYGLIGSTFIIGRFGIHHIREENIFDKTVLALEEIKEKLNGKEYLFNNQFTAADLTLTSLIGPLKFVTPLFIKYKSLFDYSENIRQKHDPRKFQDPNLMRLFKIHRQKNQTKSVLQLFIYKIFYLLVYPLNFFFNKNEKEETSYQYPSNNIQEKANNDNRILKLNSIINTMKFFIKYFYHLFFTIPKQMQFVNQQGQKLLNK